MPQTFRHIGIIGKLGAIRVQDALARTLAVLEQRNLRYSLDPDTVPPEYQAIPAARPVSAWDNVDLCIVIGGDGTFLYASRTLIDRQIPLIGIHTGRLGFLADLTLDDLAAQLDRILAGHYQCEQRHTLKVTIDSRDGRAEHLAINDAVIRSSKAQMIELDVYSHDRYLSHYRADGLIIATPTGSTAYALSAGGPIIPPHLDSMLLAPLCAHTLYSRPLMAAAADRISLIPRDGSRDITLTQDGQLCYEVLPGDRVDVVALDIAVRAQVRGQSGPALMSALADGLAPLDAELVETDWALLASTVHGALSQRALVVVLTALDGSGGEAPMVRALSTVARDHTVILASPTDPELADLRADRADSEAVYTAAAAEHDVIELDRMRRRLRRYGIEVVEAEPGRIAPALADAYLSLKAAGRL